LFLLLHQLLLQPLGPVLGCLLIFFLSNLFLVLLKLSLSFFLQKTSKIEERKRKRKKKRKKKKENKPALTFPG